MASRKIYRYYIPMNRLLPYMLLLIAGVVAYFSFFGDEGYAKLTSLRESLTSQQEKNREASNEVKKLRRDVRSLQSDPREIEKAARNELGMARPNEVILFFNHQKDPSHE